MVVFFYYVRNNEKNTVLLYAKLMSLAQMVALQYVRKRRMCGMVADREK